MELLIAATVATALFFAVRAIASATAPSVTMEQRLGSLGGPRDLERVGDGSTATSRLLRPLGSWISGRLSALLPTHILHYFEKQRILAGEPMSQTALMTFLALTPIVLGGIGLLMALRSGSSPSMFLLMAGGLTAFGLIVPVIWLSGRVSRRQLKITKELPDALDLLVVSVEAGLGFEAAMARVSDHGFGPVAVELKRVLADLSLGLGRRAAMQGLANRTGVPAVGSFVAAILQADQTGMGLGQVLRAQSEHLRTQRRQTAEEQAMKAPLKMLFPLIFFIFPSLFVVILAPAVLTFLETMSG